MGSAAARVYDLLGDGKPRTAIEIAKESGTSVAAVHKVLQKFRPPRTNEAPYRYRQWEGGTGRTGGERVMALLRQHPTCTFTAREIAAKVYMSEGAVRRFLMVEGVGYVTGPKTSRRYGVGVKVVAESSQGSVRQRAERLLAERGAMSTVEIATALGVALVSVQSALGKSELPSATVAKEAFAPGGRTRYYAASVIAIKERLDGASSEVTE
jgi:transposase